jgi:hypothetical protein
MQLPCTQSSVPLQEWPQAPQFFVSVCVSTHCPPQGEPLSHTAESEAPVSAATSTPPSCSGFDPDELEVHPEAHRPARAEQSAKR